MKRVIVKLGGTNGSGKTTIARELLSRMDVAETVRGPSPRGGKIVKPHGYTGRIGNLTWGILGSYENVCGGMDTIVDKEERLRLVRYWAERKDIDVVFFEGLITGKTYGAFGAMSEEPEHKGRWMYAFMDTPFDKCVARVLKRRLERGNDQPFDAERTMRPTYRAVESVAARAMEVGHAVYSIDHRWIPSKAASNLVNEVEEFARAR